MRRRGALTRVAEAGTDCGNYVREGPMRCFCSPSEDRPVYKSARHETRSEQRLTFMGLLSGSFDSIFRASVRLWMVLDSRDWRAEISVMRHGLGEWPLSTSSIIRSCWRQRPTKPSARQFRACWPRKKPSWPHRAPSRPRGRRLNRAVSLASTHAKCRTTSIRLLASASI